MQTDKSKALGRCWVCGRALSANQRLVFDHVQAARHHNCPKNKLVDALRERAEARSCTPPELLLMRLAEMQRRIIGGLGNLSFQQFYNPGPQGYLTLRLSDSGFTILVELRPALPPDAIYHEELIAPGALQQTREQMLRQIADTAAQHGLSLERCEAEKQMIEQLKHGANHWDGRQKWDLSLEVLSTRGTGFKAFSFMESDHELALQTLTECPMRLQQLSQQVLGGSWRQTTP